MDEEAAAEEEDGDELGDADGQEEGRNCAPRRAHCEENPRRLNQLCVLAVQKVLLDWCLEEEDLLQRDDENVELVRAQQADHERLQQRQPKSLLPPSHSNVAQMYAPAPSPSSPRRR